MSSMISMAKPQGARTDGQSGQEAFNTSSTQREPFRLRLWLPLTLLWILLAPFALVAAPFLTLIPALREVSPFRAAVAIGRVLFSLSGTVVDIDCPGAVLHIRIF